MEQNIHKEHLNIGEDGKLKGLYRLDTSKVKGIDIWAKLDQVINDYAKIHKWEMIECVTANAATMKTMLREDGRTGRRDLANLRYGCDIPVALMFKLEQVEPELFSNKKLFHKFLNKYKGFRVCQKV